jgi:hypothetical protein
MQMFYSFALMALVAVLGGGTMVGALVFAAGFGMKVGEKPSEEGDGGLGHLRIAFFLSVGLSVVAAFLFAMLGYLIGAP